MSDATDDLETGSPTLKLWLDHQLQLQRKAYGSDPQELSIADKCHFIQWNVTALTDELHEALAEVGWKPWSSRKYIDRDAYVKELIDALHFLGNLFLVVDATPEEIMDKYLKKAAVNAKRQEDGYDSTNKCATCKRALDEPE